MALARKPGSMRNLADRAIFFAEELQRMPDASFYNVSMRRGSHRRFERLAKVMRAQLCDRGEFDKAKFVGQMRVDVIEHASHLPGRKPASVRDRRTLRGRKGRAPPPPLISSAAVA